MILKFPIVSSSPTNDPRQITTEEAGFRAFLSTLPRGDELQASVQDALHPLPQTDSWQRISSTPSNPDRQLDTKQKQEQQSIQLLTEELRKRPESCVAVSTHCVAMMALMREEEWIPNGTVAECMLFDDDTETSQGPGQEVWLKRVKMWACPCPEKTS